MNLKDILINVSFQALLPYCTSVEKRDDILIIGVQIQIYINVNNGNELQNSKKINK